MSFSPATCKMRLATLLLSVFFGLFCAYLGACCSYVLLSRGVLAGDLAAAAAPRGLRTTAPTAAGGASAALQLDEDASEEAAIRAQVGRASWELLHRAAAAFDAEPSPQRRADAERFFGLAAELYPCKECGSHFLALIKKSPVDAGDNKRLSLWLCKAHNKVNVRLGKPEFPCTLGSLAERWGKCGCFGNLTETEKKRVE